MSTYSLTNRYDDDHDFNGIVVKKDNKELFKIFECDLLSYEPFSDSCGCIEFESVELMFRDFKRKYSFHKLSDRVLLLIFIKASIKAIEKEDGNYAIALITLIHKRMKTTIITDVCKAFDTLRLSDSIIGDMGPIKNPNSGNKIKAYMINIPGFMKVSITD